MNMRSLIKSHKRDQSDSQLLPSEFDFENSFNFEDPLLPPPLNLSPSKPSSPTLNKGKKLQRLFHRSRHSSPNILNYNNSLSPVSPKKSSPPSIIGTRTHEWGTNITKRTSVTSQHSIELGSDVTEKNYQEETSKEVNNEEKDDQIQLPLNTVLEIPRTNASSIKSVHRKAQIHSTDTPLERATDVFPDLRTPENKDEDDEDEESHGDSDSEFSFEQNDIAGRNTSIRYYKSEQEINKPVEHQPGYFINDLIDDNFDEDMNYFDEDDEFNDDEELFNRKYFDDDDDTPKRPIMAPINPPMKQTIEQQPTEKQLIENPQIQKVSIQKPPIVKPSRSLKYHQLPKGLDQEFSSKRYSWFSDDENQYQKEDNHFLSRQNSFDEEDYLDEINTIPENYEYEREETSSNNISKSRSLNSSLKRVQKIVMDNNTGQQLNKIVTDSKTVTLFNNQSSNNNSNRNTFSYLTPNSSFTSPNPQFMKSDNLDLSPISEGSFDSP